MQEGEEERERERENETERDGEEEDHASRENESVREREGVREEKGEGGEQRSWTREKERKEGRGRVSGGRGGWGMGFQTKSIQSRCPVERYPRECRGKCWPKQ